MGTIVKVVMFILPIGGSQMWRPPELGKGPLASQTWETKPMRGGARTFGQTHNPADSPGSTLENYRGQRTRSYLRGCLTQRSPPFDEPPSVLWAVASSADPLFK